MADARREHDWSQTASLLALTANVNRDPKKHRAFKPADFMPQWNQKPAIHPPVDIQVLRRVFVDNRPEN
jgi:hypothetical protein